MNKIAEKAKFIDLYASRPEISFGKDGKVYSRLGFLLTFITIFIIGGITIWLGIRIFGRQTPSFIQYDLPPKTWNPMIPWTTDDFKFGITVTEEFSVGYVALNPTYTGVETGKLFTIPIGIESDCRFNITGARKHTCFYQSEKTKGETYLDSKGMWNFTVQFETCHFGNPDGIDCYNPIYETEYMEKIKNTGIANIVFEDLSIDPLDYENPLTSVETGVAELILRDVGTTVVIELNEIEFTSDNGWIFQSLKTERRLKPTTTLKLSTHKMLSIQIIYGGTKTIYKRTYPKIQDFFAQVSGFITIITPIFLLMVSPYGNLQAIQHMVNEIFEIKLNKTDANVGESLKKPVTKKKKKPSQHKGNLTTTTLTGAGTERNLLSKETISKFKNRVPKSIPLASHSALIIQDVATKDDASPIPEENIAPFSFEFSEKLPSSPLRSTLISPGHDQSKLISPRNDPPEEQKTDNEQLDENLEPVKAKGEREKQNLTSEGEEDEEEEVPLRTSDPLQVTWQDWLKSFWKPSPEVQVLNKAKEHLTETFDLVTLSKKVIEIDKLKACLLTQEQRVIFENLPSSIIVLNPHIDIESPEAIKQYHWKDSFKGDQTALRKAYAKLKGTKNELDQLLLKLYESENIYDRLSS